MTDNNEDLLDLINALMQALKDDTAHTLAAGPDPLAPLEARALRFFAQHAGASQAAFAQFCGRDKAQVTRAIQHLQEHQLLEREAGGSDRRHHHWRLSEAGLAVYARVATQRKRLAARLVHDFAPAEKASARALLARMQANVTATAPQK